jgi:hypothetical protein
MSGGKKFSPPQKIGARTFSGSPDAQYPTSTDEDWTAALAYAPFHRREFAWSIVILSYLAELLGTFVFAFVINLAKSSITGPMSSVETFLAGTFLGMIGGLTYYLAAGWNMDVPNSEYAELPKHLSWTVSFAYALVFRLGALPLLGYLFSQTVGSLMAGGLLYFLGKGTLPTASAASIGTTWFVEIIGVFFIVFPLLFKHLLGASTQEEEYRRRNAHFYAAGGRAFATAILFQFQGYSFDAVVYLAGLIALCTSEGCPNSTPFGGAPAFYILAPLVGVLVVVAFYLITLGLVACAGKRKAGKRSAISFKTAAEAVATDHESEVINAPLVNNNASQRRKATTAQDLDKYK